MSMSAGPSDRTLILVERRPVVQPVSVCVDSGGAGVRLTLLDAGPPTPPASAWPRSLILQPLDRPPPAWRNPATPMLNLVGVLLALVVLAPPVAAKAQPASENLPESAALKIHKSIMRDGVPEKSKSTG
jgi:hypothetical protein